MEPPTTGDRRDWHFEAADRYSQRVNINLNLVFGATVCLGRLGWVDRGDG